MLNILVTPVRGIVKEAERQASAAGSTSVEAEHLLLAVASAAVRDYAHGYQLAMLAGAGLALVGALVSLTRGGVVEQAAEGPPSI